MTTLKMKPIRFDHRQVALMVKVANRSDPRFAKKLNETSDVIDLCIDLIAEGCMEPSHAILRYFALRKDGKGYLWNLL